MTSTDLFHTIHHSPIGPLTLVGSERGLSELRFPGDERPAGAPRPEHFADALVQLEEYFAGARRRFELTLDIVRGTDFQRAVWEQLRTIPHGSTITYGELAARLGPVDRVRAVGAAVGRTPVPIVIPCHRVIGADGSLTGYGGGLERKRALLDLEAGRLALV
jgi:methylated-DNA-[protein]-cysteine S-methyltransferase